MTAAVERLLLFPADVDHLNGIDGSICFKRGGGKLIPAGETHIGDQADFLLPRGLVQKFIGFAQSGRQICRAVGDLDTVQLFEQHVLFDP